MTLKKIYYHLFLALLYWCINYFPYFPPLYTIISVPIIWIVGYYFSEFINTNKYIREFKHLINKNKDFNNVTNLDDISKWYCGSKEVQSIFKGIFYSEVYGIWIDKNTLRLGNGKYTFFVNSLSNNKHKLCLFETDYWTSGKSYGDMLDKPVNKKELKEFFKDMNERSKRTNADVVEYNHKIQQDKMLEDIANRCSPYF